MAKTDYFLLVASILLSLIGVVIAFDVFAAIGADACGEGAGSANCYPWGAEGPASESWRYESKCIYIATSVAIAVLPIIATASIALKGAQRLQLSGRDRAVVGTTLAVVLVLIFA
jgi:hypothetical protein